MSPLFAIWSVSDSTSRICQWALKLFNEWKSPTVRRGNTCHSARRVNHSATRQKKDSGDGTRPKLCQKTKTNKQTKPILPPCYICCAPCSMCRWSTLFFSGARFDFTQTVCRMIFSAFVFAIHGDGHVARKIFCGYIICGKNKSPCPEFMNLYIPVARFPIGNVCHP